MARPRVFLEGQQISLNVTLTKEMYDRLYHTSRFRRCSMANVVRHAILDSVPYLNKFPRKVEDV